MKSGGSAGRQLVRLRRRRSVLFTAVLGMITLATLAGCGSSGNSGSGPAVIGNTKDAPDTGQAGTGRVGDISVPKGTYVPVEHGVSLRLDISNAGADADQLVQATSNVGGAGTLAPDPIVISARSTVHVGSGDTTITLPITGSLDPGETLAVTLTFAKSGHLLVYALTSS
jgi:hypothetical protein